MAVRKPRSQKSTRAQRRVAERESRKQQRRKPQTTGPSSGLIGGVITGLILVAIVAIIAVKYFSSNQTSGTGVTIANDYNPTANMLKKGTVAPNFTLKTVNGTKYSLAAQRGHPVFLEFFAVWCPHCHDEAPIMAKITKNYVPKGVRVWSVLANPYGPDYESGSLNLATKSDLQFFANYYNVKHPQLINPTFNVVNEYGITGYPGLYVINKHGVITYVNSGEQPYSTLSKALNSALK